MKNCKKNTNPGTVMTMRADCSMKKRGKNILWSAIFPISPRVKVSDFLTGEDITDEFSFDDVNRVYMPSDHLNLSKVMFKNTVSIDQVGAKTEENLAEEVNNLMANMDTGFGDISIHKAIKDLRSAAEKIAGKRGEVRQIGQLNQILEKIMQEKDNTEAIIQNDKQRKMKIDYLQEQLQRIQESELAEKVKLVNKYEEILENIQDTKGKLAQLHHVDSVNEEAYEQVLRLENDVNKELEALKNLKEKIDSVEHAIEKMHAELSQYEQLRDINEIRQDYALYQQLKEGAYRKKPSRLENIVLIACIVFALLSIFFIFKKYGCSNHYQSSYYDCGFCLYVSCKNNKRRRAQFGHLQKIWFC